MLLGMFQKKLLSLARQINAAFIFLHSSRNETSGRLRGIHFCFNIATFVFLIGKISELDKQFLYNNSLGLLFPSLREGFGLPIIEAMSFGKPCFLSNNTCLPEIGGNLSFYWDNYDSEYMANIVKKGLNTYNNNPNMKDLLIQRSNEFSWENAANSYLKIYKSII